MKSNILIITGGTGGHVIPAVNFYNYIKNESDDVFLVTDNRGSKYIKNIDNNKILKIKSSHLIGNITFKFKALIKLLLGLIQSILIFLKLRPKIIISFGSYASLPPLFCFILFKIFFKTQLYIHEQNSVIGQTNKIFSKFANKIFVNFDKHYPTIKNNKKKIIVVGLPENKNYNSFNYDGKEDNKYFNFLVYAGSQGSIDILITFNQIIDEIKKISNYKKIKFIVQSPIQKQKEIKNLLIKNNYDFEIKVFFDNFDKILKKTDIVLCRSGAGTINDLIKYRIPAIICPLPSAKEDHQYENAKILTNIGCALIVNNNKINIEEIILFINNVVNDKNFKKSLLDNYSKIKRYNANKLMWKHIHNG